MQLTLTTEIPVLANPIRYTDHILLIGSCFTEHIASRLANHKFKVMQNPHGILFNPLSVAKSIESYLDDKTYGVADLFFLNGTWNSWDHHSRFSDIDAEKTIDKINSSQTDASKFIRKTDWVIITLGSAFQYYLKENDNPVANNHRAPAQWFEKRLLSIDAITAALKGMLDKLFTIIPSVEVLFTISPVRHIRDGVVNNNRSKARLIESVHELCEVFPQCQYFPAYELVIDVLRDYRFYDIDFVHPNYFATEIVWEEFVKACVTPEALPAMKQVKDIKTAMTHLPRFPGTDEHKKFMKSYYEKVMIMMKTFPFLDLSNELQYFSAE